MFKILGALVAIYTLWAAWAGEVIAKDGPWGRKVLRQDSPRYFWTVIGIYSALSVALFTVF